MECKKKLNIWLIKEGEPLPLSKEERLMRMGMLAEYLAWRGHSVTWWTSTFNHAKKEYYCNGYAERHIKENEDIVLLHSKFIYRKNVSLSRILYHQILAHEFKKRSKVKGKPDIIICAWPTQQFAEAAVQYGRLNKVPVLVDVRDLWPDIFVRVFPKKMKSLANVLLLPMKYSAARTFKKVTGIIGKEKNSLEWACRYAGRSPGNTDACIFIGNKKFLIDNEAFIMNMSWLAQLGVTEKTWNICFFSTLSEKSLDIATLIQAVLYISNFHSDIRLVIGGKGDAEEKLKSMSGNSPNVIFAGWLDQNQMNSIMSISRCGAYCLKNTDDFTDTFTNKAVQYLSAGLPILNSLKGFARKLVSEKGIGITYEEGNIESCVAAILKMYNNEKQREEMSEKAAEVFNMMFESSIVNQQFEEHIFHVIEMMR